MAEPERHPGAPVWSRTDGMACGLLTLAWLLPIPIVGVSGEFALNDDWAYILVVRRFLEEGVYQRTTWTFTPVLSNLAIGAGFTTLFGSSLAVLRASSLVMGWLSMLGAYAWGRMQGVSAGACALVALCLAFNPVHLSLAYTFMTDVAFTAMVVWALALFGLGSSRGRAWPYVAGGVCAALALLSRQPGILIFGGLALTLGVRLTARPKLLLVLAGAGAAAVGGYALVAWLVLEPDSRGLLHLVTMTLRDPALGYFLLRHGLDAACYLGLFVLPLALGLELPRGAEARAAWAGAGLAVAATVAGMVALGLDPPTGLNVIAPGGVGPITLHGVAAHHAPLPSGLWWALSLAGAATSGYLLARILERVWGAGLTGLRKRPAWTLALAAGAVYLLPLLIRGVFFDRYLLPVVPCLALGLLLAPRAPRLARPRLSAAAVALVAAASVVGTADYMRHHRARQALIDGLLAQSVALRDIEGGFEFDGLHRFEGLAVETGAAPEAGRFDIANNYALLDRARAMVEGSAAHWPYGDRYLISFSPAVQGYRVVARRSHARWLLLGTETLYAHERLP